MDSTPHYAKKKYYGFEEQEKHIEIWRGNIIEIGHLKDWEEVVGCI
jgi:hypothetical protein